MCVSWSPGSRRSNSSPGVKTARWRIDADSEDAGAGMLPGLRFEEAEAVLHVVEAAKYNASLQVLYLSASSLT